MLHSPALFALGKVFLSPVAFTQLSIIFASFKNALNFGVACFFSDRLVLGLPSSLSPQKISAPCKISIHLPSLMMWIMAFPMGCTEPTPMSLKLSPPLPPLPHPPVMDDRHPVVTRYANFKP